MGQAFQDTVPVAVLEHQADLQKIPAVVKVLVRCRREDIDVLELESKTTPRRILDLGMGHEKKMKLAEELIKEVLEHGGLEFEDIAEKFSSITVADVIATEE